MLWIDDDCLYRILCFLTPYGHVSPLTNVALLAHRFAACVRRRIDHLQPNEMGYSRRKVSHIDAVNPALQVPRSTCYASYRQSVQVRKEWYKRYCDIIQLPYDPDIVDPPPPWPREETYVVLDSSWARNTCTVLKLMECAVAEEMHCPSFQASYTATCESAWDDQRVVFRSYPKSPRLSHYEVKNALQDGLRESPCNASVSLVFLRNPRPGSGPASPCSPRSTHTMQ